MDASENFEVDGCEVVIHEKHGGANLSIYDQSYGCQDGSDVHMILSADEAEKLGSALLAAAASLRASKASA